MATMRDVADRAGVSIATVSFLLNDTKPISPRTRARIENAMSALGYRRSLMARALASRRSHILGLAYPALQHKLGDTAAEFVTSAAARARQLDYHLMLWPVSNDTDELSELLSSEAADALLLMEVLFDDPRIPVLHQAGIPFTLIGRTADPTGLDCVDIDFEHSMTTAVDHLQNLGHRDIALIQEGPLRKGLRGYGPTRRTRAAFRRLTKERGLAATVAECGRTASHGRRAAARLTANHPEITAVLVQNDHAAVGVVAGLQNAGLEVPNDISVLSLLTSPDLGNMSDPVLTMIESPGAQLGELGIDRVLSQLDGNPIPAPELIPGTFQHGMSTGPVCNRRREKPREPS